MRRVLIVLALAGCVDSDPPPVGAAFAVEVHEFPLDGRQARSLGYPGIHGPIVDEDAVVVGLQPTISAAVVPTSGAAFSVLPCEQAASPCYFLTCDAYIGCDPVARTDYGIWLEPSYLGYPGMFHVEIVVE